MTDYFGKRPARTSQKLISGVFFCGFLVLSTFIIVCALHAGDLWVQSLIHQSTRTCISDKSIWANPFPHVFLLCSSSICLGFSRSQKNAKLRRNRRQMMKPTRKPSMLKFRFPVWIFLMLFARDRILWAKAYWKASKVF